MRLIRVLLGIFPPSRRRVTLRSALTPALFLLVFAAVLLTLGIRSLVRFSRPEAFWLLLAVPYMWWIHMAGYGTFLRLRSEVALAVRLLLVGLFILVLAGPSAVRESDRLAVVYTLDVSHSIGERAADQALNYILKTVSGKPATDEAGLVVFGREAGVELPPRTAFPFEALNLRISGDGTNLGKGLKLAAAMCPEGQPARIVLISDGVQTEGNAVEVVADLKARGIPVDVLPIQYDYQDEVWLERLDLPRHVKHGETYEASVLLSSLRPGTGKLVLSENGRPLFEETVSFKAGKNLFKLPIYLRETGYYEYNATIKVPEDRDHHAENNTVVGAVYLEGKGKVLVVTDPAGSPRDWKPLVNAMKRSEREVEVMPAYSFPSDASLLLPYHAVFFLNVPADEFPPPQQEALRDAVFNFGTGFCMVGGENSFGAGGYHNTAVEEALPVTMDVSQKRVIPKGGLVIILHTCEFPQGNTYAKRITKEAIKVLGAEDDVGVLASKDYDGNDYWVFELSPAGEYEDLVPLINRAMIGDMPAFGPAMKMGLDALVASDASAKHMIIISDGDPTPPMPSLLKEFKTAGVSISTVAIYPHPGFGVDLMKRIAGATGGRFYYPKTPSALPRIFIKEAKTLRKNLIQNKTFTPVHSFPSPIMKGLEGTPLLHGYVMCSPKARAQVILKVPEPEIVEPVLAVWRFGVGKAAAFTSDLTANWGRDWVEWNQYQAFVNQLLVEISRGKQDSQLHLRAVASGGTGVVEVEFLGKGAGPSTYVAAVRDPGGKVVNLRLNPVGPGRFRGEFPLRTRGRYQIMVGGGGGTDGESGQAMGSLVVPYSVETMRFRADPILLRKVASGTGGRVLEGTESGEHIFTRERESRFLTRPVFDWFLICLVFLIPLDVAVRRIQIDLAAVMNALGFNRDRGTSGKTLGGLLQRKSSLGIPSAGTEPPPAQYIQDIPEKKDKEKKSDQAPTVDPPVDGEPLSTTEKLLELKRRRKQDES